MIHEGYGQSETTLISATFPGMTVKPGSMGRATPGYDVRVRTFSQKNVSTQIIQEVNTSPKIIYLNEHLNVSFDN